VSDQSAQCGRVLREFVQYRWELRHHEHLKHTPGLGARVNLPKIEDPVQCRDPLQQRAGPAKASRPERAQHAAVAPSGSLSRCRPADAEDHGASAPVARPCPRRPSWFDTPRPGRWGVAPIAGGAARP
jgi:hypothetical protein